MLEQQTARNNAAGDVFGDRSAAEYNWKTSARQDLWNEYNAARQGAPELVGGYAGTPDWYGPAADFYRSMMETGGVTDADKANIRSLASAVPTGLYAGLKNNMTRMNAATGGYAGYNSQLAKLGREGAREGSRAIQESEAGILDMINRNKFQAAQGLESSFHKGSPGSAGSRGGVGSSDYYLNKMEGLMEGTTDLPYANLQLGAYGAGTGAVTHRVDETPGWQKALYSAIPSAAGAAIGAFTGGGGKKKPVDGGYY